MAHGKGGCALFIALGLHVIGLVALIAGTLTPYWSRIYDTTSGDVTGYSGLLVSMNSDGSLTFTDFNTMKDADTNETTLFRVLAISFGIGAIFLEFFLVQAYAFARCNNSCGRSYNPDWLMIFSLLSGLFSITCLILYQQYIGKSLESLADTNEIKLDYSRGFVIIFIALAFLAAFFTVCDRTQNAKDDDDYDDVSKKRKRRK